MSAMPERCLHDFIEANENGWMCTECGVHFEPAQRAIDAESRLLAAEARVREVEAAFKKYGDHWAQCPAMTPRRKCNCGYAQARAILAREAGE